jgi:hypothetical protein
MLAPRRGWRYRPAPTAPVGTVLQPMRRWSDGAHCWAGRACRLVKEKRMPSAPRSASSSTTAPRLASLGLAAATVLAFSALAASPREPTNPKAQYQREAGRCMVLRQLDDRDNCLDAAYGRYLNTQPTPTEELAHQLKANALKRCEPLPEALRKDCIERMSGGGTQTGSVAEGGVYRELVTIVVGPRPAPVPAEPPASAAAQTQSQTQVKP